MTNPEARLQELGIQLPGLQPAVGNYLGAKRHADLVYVSGHGPIRVGSDGLIAGMTTRNITVPDALPALVTGKVGGDLTVEEGREAARLTTLFLLSSLRAEIGSLDRVTSIIKVFGMVNCAPGFNNTVGVVDGCSDLLVDIFGDEVGRHARSAVGMAELPLNIPVEIEMIVAVDQNHS